MKKTDAVADAIRKNAVQKTCIAKREDACTRTGDCLECSPLEQSLRTAGSVLARWPRQPRGRRS